MNEAKREAKSKAEVMQAFVKGSVIECKAHGFLTWVHTPCPSWDWRGYDYRVAVPKTRTVTLQAWVCRAGQETYVGLLSDHKPGNAIAPYGDPITVEVPE